MVEGAALVIAVALGLALVHLVADMLPFSAPLTRERWLSAGAGISIVYVFLYLIPKLYAGREAIPGPEDAVILGLVFCGLTAFFGLERIACITEDRYFDIGTSHVRVAPVYWMHIAVFALYNAVIGFTLADGALMDGRLAFAVAMGMHLFSLDEGLRSHHQETYHRTGRWVLAGAILVGAIGGLVIPLDLAIQIGLLGLLGGGIIFNAIKEELPPDEESSFLAFIAGAVVFVGVMAIVP